MLLKRDQPGVAVAPGGQEFLYFSEYTMYVILRTAGPDKHRPRYYARYIVLLQILFVSTGQDAARSRVGGPRDIRDRDVWNLPLIRGSDVGLVLDDKNTAFECNRPRLSTHP